MTTQGASKSFTEKGDFLAYAGVDGVLKVWETENGKSVADFSPSKHLTAVCTCLEWNYGRHCKHDSPHKPPKKKKKKTDVETAVGSLSLVAMGTASGTVLLYSFARGEMHTHLEKGHTDEVTDVCWHPNGLTLFSCSLDGHVVEWDVASSQLKEKWKASSGAVHSMCLCGTDRLLTADHTIKMWDLTTKKVLQKFTGHSTEVFQLLPVLQPSTGGGGGEQERSTCSYFLSAAANDRVVNAWMCHPDSSEKKAITSFSLTEEPSEMNMLITKEQTVILAVLTIKGNVMVFEHTLNGKLKKPLKANTVIQAATAGSKAEVSVPVPILAALPRMVSGAPSLLVAHGSVTRPKFEPVSLKPTQPEMVLVVSEPEKKAVFGDFSQVKTPQVSGSTVLYPGHMAPVGPTMTEEAQRRKRKKSVSELTVGERLEAMGTEKPGQAAGTSKPPRADQLVIQLTQGLQSGDAKLLTNAFQERKATTVMNTVKRLPLPVILPLLKEVTQRMRGHPQSGNAMVRWLNHILCIHMAYLMTIPNLTDTLAELCQFIEYRLQSFQKCTEMGGKLGLLLSRIATQEQVEEEPTQSSQAILVYQDVSTDDEATAMEEDDASGSEVNWDDSDGPASDSDSD